MSTRSSNRAKTNRRFGGDDTLVFHGITSVAGIADLPNSPPRIPLSPNVLGRNREPVHSHQALPAAFRRRVEGRGPGANPAARVSAPYFRPQLERRLNLKLVVHCANGLSCSSGFFPVRFVRSEGATQAHPSHFVSVFVWTRFRSGRAPERWRNCSGPEFDAGGGRSRSCTSGIGGRIAD